MSKHTKRNITYSCLANLSPPPPIPRSLMPALCTLLLPSIPSTQVVPTRRPQAIARKPRHAALALKRRRSVALLAVRRVGEGRLERCDVVAAVPAGRHRIGVPRRRARDPRRRAREPRLVSGMVGKLSNKLGILKIINILNLLNLLHILHILNILAPASALSAAALPHTALTAALPAAAPATTASSAAW